MIDTLDMVNELRDALLEFESMNCKSLGDAKTKLAILEVNITHDLYHKACYKLILNAYNHSPVRDNLVGHPEIKLEWILPKSGKFE